MKARRSGKKGKELINPFQNPVKALDFEQVLTGEAFLFLAETVDPDGLEAEVGRSADIPGIGREEEDFTGFGFELFDGKLVDPWIGFEDSDFFHREDRIDQLFKTRVVYPGSKHFGGPLERIAVPKPRSLSHFRVSETSG